MPRRLKEKTWLEILNEAKSKRRTTIGGIPGWKADFSYFNKNQKPLFGVRLHKFRKNSNYLLFSGWDYYESRATTGA